MSPSRTLATSLSASAEQRRWRYHVLPTLQGAVLDVGAGSGICGQALDPQAHWLALEPAPGRRLEEAVRSRPRSQLLRATAEQIPLAEASVDAVICSTVLCSVTDPARALAEFLRVLRPQGRLVLFEHVASAPGTAARRVQRLVRPLTRLVDRGCDPCRDTAAAIHQAGFSTVDLETLRTGGLLGGLIPYIRGQAVR